MKPKRAPTKDILGLLTFARRHLAAASKPSALKGFSDSLRGIERQAKRIRRQAAKGKISAAFARRALSKLKAASRDITRHKAATAVLARRALRTLDTQIRRAKPAVRR